MENSLIVDSGFVVIFTLSGLKKKTAGLRIISVYYTLSVGFVKIVPIGSNKVGVKWETVSEFLSTLLFAVIFIAGLYGFYKLLFFLLARSGRNAMEEINATLARATPALAQVLNLGEPSLMGRKPRMSAVYSALQLEVHPPTGEPYEASTIWEVNRAALPEIQPGQTVAIRIDSEKPGTIYPDVNWAWFNWP